MQWSEVEVRLRVRMGRVEGGGDVGKIGKNRLRDDSARSCAKYLVQHLEYLTADE